MSLLAKIGAKLGGKVTEKIMGGAQKLQAGKTERIQTTRGWAAPILGLMAGLPFCLVLWMHTIGTLWQIPSYINNSVAFININPTLFYSVILSLIGGVSGAIALTARKKLEVEKEMQKEEQETIRQVAKKDDLLEPFDQAFNETMGHEGGYVNDPDDNGGETYRGIARKFHKDWEGWKLIDKLKRGKVRTKKGMERFTKRLKANEKKLDVYVRDFYEQKFWITGKCDQVAKLSRKIAIDLFDTGVNCGISASGKFLQRAVNNCRHGLLSEELVVDGKIGSSTIQALDSLLPRYEKAVFRSMNGELYEHYEALCKKKPSQWKFFRGWMQRVGF